jgi:hypothetical protein
MVKRRVRIQTLRVALLAVIMSLAARATSYAGPLPLTLDQYPVMNAQTITSLFNASTGLFTANGTAVGWNDGSGNNPIAYAFKLTANFSGGVPTSASLIIGSESSPYLTASGLSDFAFSAVKGGTIEFLFNTVGGSSGVFASGAPLDVQITVSSTFTPQFTTSWMNSQETAILRQQDVPTDTVPEPSSLLAIVVGGGGLLLRRWRAATA